MAACTRAVSRRLAAAALVVLGSASASAQTPPSVGLNDVLRSAIEKSPVVQLARENVNAQQATVRVSRGAFDSSLHIGPMFLHREDALTGALFQQEQLKRAISKGLANAFGKVADAYDQQLKSGRADMPICPADGDFGILVVRLPGSGLPVPVCRPASVNFDVGLDSSLDALSGLSSADLYRRPRTLDPLAILDTQQKLATMFGVQVANTVLDVHERGFEMLNQVRVAARDVEMKAALAYQRLGAMPEWQYTNTASIFGQFSKMFRNGTLLQFQASFDGRGALYRDKPLDPAFGGRDTTNRFGSKLEAVWLQPMKRGRGAETVRAAERAAISNVEATRFTYQQAAADQALVAAEAYFDLMAAQESYASTERSLQNQRQILENTIKLVGAGEVARNDLARGQARTAEVQAQLATARLSLLSAQVALADAMGVSHKEVPSMRASDVFPAKPADLDVEALARNALTSRADVRAASAFRDTANILVSAARSETRSRFDLTFRGGFAQTYYGPAFRSLPDEYRNYPEILGTDSYVKYYNLSGLGRALKAKWEPIAAVSGYVELPFRNNQRLGRLAQARASVTDSEVRLADTRRVIEMNLPRLAEELRRSRLEWEQRQDAVIQWETTWDGAQRQRAAGEMTLIDLLLTEQQLTQARLQLVQAKRDFAGAVARFKRETGTLVTYSDWSKGQASLAGVVATQ